MGRLGRDSKILTSQKQTTHRTENEQLREWLKGSDQATHKLHGQIAKTEAELARQKHQREEVRLITLITYLLLLSLLHNSTTLNILALRVP